MKKTDGWVTALFALVFIAVPAVILFYFFLPEWTDKKPINYSYIWLIAISFWVYTGILTFILIRFEWLSIDSINFNIPISITMMLILLTSPLPLWATALFVLFGILTAFPTNIFVTRLKEKQIKKNQNKKKQY